MDALFQIVLVGGLMLLNDALDSILLGTPLRSLMVKERRANSSVKLVEVHGVYPVLQPSVLGLKLRYGFVVLTLLIGVALPKRHFHPLQDIGFEPQTLQQIGKSLLQNLFSRVWLGAFSLVPGAVVVDVTAFLNFPYERTAAVPAFHESREGEVVLHLPMALFEAVVHDLLGTLPKLS